MWTFQESNLQKSPIHEPGRVPIVRGQTSPTWEPPLLYTNTDGGDAILATTTPTVRLLACRPACLRVCMPSRFLFFFASDQPRNGLDWIDLCF